jgi:hypothetical protein
LFWVIQMVISAARPPYLITLVATPPTANARCVVRPLTCPHRRPPSHPGPPRRISPRWAIG